MSSIANNGSKYFYMATIKHATSVTDSLKANFTYSPISEAELDSKSKANVILNLSYSLIIIVYIALKEV